jgi:protein TonB
LALTLAVFALLPFSELVSRTADRQVVLRPIETTTPPLKPPEVRQPEPLLPVVAALRPASASKPHLDAPAARAPSRLGLALRPELGLRQVGDFKLDFEFSPPSPAAPDPVPTVAAAPLAPSVFAPGEVDAAPRPILQAPPVYPYGARTRNLEGYVEVRFTVTVAGRVEDVEVLDMVPDGTFVEAAKRAVVRWRFEPGVKDGRQVPVRVQVKVRFELR